MNRTLPFPLPPASLFNVRKTALMSCAIELLTSDAVYSSSG